MTTKAEHFAESNARVDAMAEDLRALVPKWRKSGAHLEEVLLAFTKAAQITAEANLHRRREDAFR